jgi:hypothetical protein
MAQVCPRVKTIPGTVVFFSSEPEASATVKWPPLTLQTA